MVAPAELSCLTAELLSIEKLIHELLHRQSQLTSRLRLAGAELTLAPVSEPSLRDDSAIPSTSWTTVPKTKNRISLPFFSDPLGDENDDDPLQLSNHYGPLQGLDEDRPLPPNSAVSPKILAGSSSWTSVVKGGGAGPRSSSRRKRTSLCSSASNSRTSSPSRKHSRLSPSLALSTAPCPPLLPPATSATSSASSLVFPPPKYILVGDSIVRYVAIPNGITYSFSGAKIHDLVQCIPAIVEQYPSAHTVIVHVGTNDIRCRQSIKLRYDYELLAVTIESLGKIYIFSGLMQIFLSPHPGHREPQDTLQAIHEAR